MILVDVPSERIDDKSKAVSYYTYDFNLDHDTGIMEMIVSISQFNYWIRLCGSCRKGRHDDTGLYESHGIRQYHRGPDIFAFDHEHQQKLEVSRL